MTQTYLPQALPTLLVFLAYHSCVKKSTVHPPQTLHGSHFSNIGNDDNYFCASPSPNLYMWATILAIIVTSINCTKAYFSSQNVLQPKSLLFLVCNSIQFHFLFLTGRDLCIDTSMCSGHLFSIHTTHCRIIFKIISKFLQFLYGESRAVARSENPGGHLETDSQNLRMG